MIEPEGSMKYYLRNSISREMNDRIGRAELKADELERENNLYKGFIKVLGQRFEDMFYEYVKQEESRK